MSTIKCDWCGKHVDFSDSVGSSRVSGRYCCNRCKIAAESQRQKEDEKRRKEIEEAGGYWEYVKGKFKHEILPALGIVAVLSLLSLCSNI